MYSKQTKIFGIIGYPLGHTLSPWIHNTLFGLSRYDGVYLVFERPNWSEVGISPLLELGVRGISVTIPYKEWAFTLGTKQCKASQTMKASNTLIFEEGIHAVNTDGIGAVRSVLNFDSGLLSPDTNDSILVLGSGGSAKGILFEIAETLRTKAKGKLIKKEVHILARNQKAVQDIFVSLGNPAWLRSVNLDEVMDHKKKYSLVIHTTPLGMKGIQGDPMLPKSFFERSQTLFDIVYNPLETELVKFAKSKKTKIIPGYHMLLHQGIRQFELFTGIEPKKVWVLKVESILHSILKKRK
ncbi:MAG: shikimate dehydrogenase [Leptospira sp.]|nr:shikimate dehydrogenase [Leptospira sp.]